jgi:hypothetical protein
MTVLSLFIPITVYFVRIKKEGVHHDMNPES